MLVLRAKFENCLYEINKSLFNEKTKYTKLSMTDYFAEKEGMTLIRKSFETKEELDYFINKMRETTKTDDTYKEAINNFYFDLQQRLKELVNQNNASTTVEIDEEYSYEECTIATIEVKDKSNNINNNVVEFNRNSNVKFEFYFEGFNDGDWGIGEDSLNFKTINDNVMFTDYIDNEYDFETVSFRFYFNSVDEFKDFINRINNELCSSRDYLLEELKDFFNYFVKNFHKVYERGFLYNSFGGNYEGTFAELNVIK